MLGLKAWCEGAGAQPDGNNTTIRLAQTPRLVFNARRRLSKQVPRTASGRDRRFAGERRFARLDGDA